MAAFYDMGEVISTADPYDRPGLDHPDAVEMEGDTCASTQPRASISIYNDGRVTDPSMMEEPG